MIPVQIITWCIPSWYSTDVVWNPTHLYYSIIQAWKIRIMFFFFHTILEQNNSISYMYWEYSCIHFIVEYLQYSESSLHFFHHLECKYIYFPQNFRILKIKEFPVRIWISSVLKNEFCCTSDIFMSCLISVNQERCSVYYIKQGIL